MFVPVLVAKKPKLFAFSTIALAVSLAAQTQATPPTYTKPNVIATAEATSVTLNGQSFVNKGLQGVARLPARTLDFNGDTFGAFSGMDILPGSWRKTAAGYTGVLFALPDRGPNGVGSVTFSDFGARVSSFGMNFTPYVGAANLPVSVDSQQQLRLSQTGGFFFKDFNGRTTTGFDPGTGATAFVTQNGVTLPGSTVGAAAGKIALDAEGLRFLNNGSFYVSDEYGANVYYFDKTGNLQGVIQPPAAVSPRATNGASFTSQTDAVTGRRVNQGLEGLALTPDNKKIATLLQSATMQDSTSAQQTRTNTRLMIYDISQSAVPKAPIEHYVLQLPIINSTGAGNPNRTAAQSEMLALNDTQFLVLARDGNGLGQALLDPVYKSVLLVDTKGATNLAGTAYETSTTPVAPGGVLDSAITPVSQVEVVNILNTTQLGKFGLNINNKTPTQLTLTEKLEGMALVPVLEENAPQDFFLLVSNDNDFLSSTCKVGGQDCSQPVNSDALVLVYRLSLPTYVDSQYLQAMQDMAPLSIQSTTQIAQELAVSNTFNITQHLLGLRHGQAQATEGVALWLAGSWQGRDASATTSGNDGLNGSIGFDVGLSDTVRIGAAVGYAQYEPDFVGTSDSEQESAQFSLYTAFNNAQWYANASASYGDLTLNDLQRSAAYGLTATGNTGGSSFAINGEVGYMFSQDNLRFGPLAGARWLSTQITDYVETGAAGGNLSYSNLKTTGKAAYFGGELAMALNAVQAVVRFTYTDELSIDDTVANLRLNSANHSMASQALWVDHPSDSVVEASFTLSGQVAGNSSWWLNYSAKDSSAAKIDNTVKVGLLKRF